MCSHPFPPWVIYVSGCCHYPGTCWNDPGSPGPVVGSVLMLLRGVFPPSGQAQQSSAVLSAPHWAAQVGSFSHCLSTLGQRFLISWALPWKARSSLLCFEHHIILGAPHVKDSVFPPPPPITTFLPAQPYMSGVGREQLWTGELAPPSYTCGLPKNQGWWMLRKIFLLRTLSFCEF